MVLIVVASAEETALSARKETASLPPNVQEIVEAVPEVIVAAVVSLSEGRLIITESWPTRLVEVKPLEMAIGVIVSPTVALVLNEAPVNSSKPLYEEIVPLMVQRLPTVAEEAVVL